MKIKIPKLRQKFVEQFQFTTETGGSSFCENVVIGSFGKPHKLKKKLFPLDQISGNFDMNARFFSNLNTDNVVDNSVAHSWPNGSSPTLSTIRKCEKHPNVLKIEKIIFDVWLSFDFVPIGRIYN